MDSAPALSTYQDEAVFQYDKVTTQKNLKSHLHVAENAEYTQLVAAIREYYSLDDLEKHLASTNGNEILYKHITLQFPDCLLQDSATIVQELQRKMKLVALSTHELDTENASEGCQSGGCECKSPSICHSASQKMWILADTSYSPCCIDEVAAEHANSDLVVHFGDACLNPVDKVRASYVLGKPKFDRNEFQMLFEAKYPDQDSKVVLMADAPYTRYLGELYHNLKTSYKHLAFAELQSLLGNEIIDYTPLKCTGPLSLNRTFQGLDSIEDLNQYSLFHISKPHDPRLLQLTTRFHDVSIYDPISMLVDDGPYPNLMRRYRFMHMARSAGTIGILVNTLSLHHTKTLLNAVLAKIREAGKKPYMFVVGKPNVAKLANFESVDLWCVLGCDHQGIIIDQLNEYFKPIVTPYELLMALSPEVTWTGQWVTEFASVLDQLESEKTDLEDEKNDDSDQEPVFDPVTGKFVSTARPLRNIEHLRIANENDRATGALVERFSNSVAIKGTVSTSAIHLQNRQWTGLGSDFVENEEGALVEEGRGGIARGYDYDKLHQ